MPRGQPRVTKRAREPGFASPEAATQASPETEAGWHNAVRDRQRNLTADEKCSLLCRAVLLPKDAQGRIIGAAALCAEFGRAPNYLSRLIAQHKEPTGVPSPLKDRRGPGHGPQKLTPDIDHLIAQQSAEWGHDWSWAEMAEWLVDEGHLESLHPDSLRRHCVGEGWNVHGSPDVRPLHTEGHRDDRLVWAFEQQGNQWEGWVDIDEKWFFTEILHTLLKLPPGTPRPWKPTANKKQIPKSMYLAATARPIFGRGGNVLFDGKIGIWRIAAEVTAKRRSKNHERGDVYEKDTTMDGDLYEKYLKERVMPAAVKAFLALPAARRPKLITLQHDGAGAHTKTGLEDRINAFGATLEIPCRLVRQPARSPDTNINDIAFFRALGLTVRKQRRGDRSFDLEKLCQDVYDAFANYSPHTLERMWQYKTDVLDLIIGATPPGSNLYGNGHRDARAV